VVTGKTRWYNIPVINVIFESHSTTFDNESEISSGHSDAKLSPLGLEQTLELGKRYKDNLPDAVFCSDLSRSYETGEKAFEGTEVPIIKDARLRECDYGDFERHPSDEVKPMKENCIEKPFPSGESYRQCAERMKAFLQDLLKKHGGETVMIIGHRATQYGLEHWIKGIPLKKVVTAPWKWQPGWTYQLQQCPNPDCESVNISENGITNRVRAGYETDGVNSTPTKYRCNTCGEGFN